MSIAALSTATTTSSTSSSASVSAEYDQFLSILLTQLQYQSPLDPMDTAEFTSQIAQYSQLEQQINSNDKLDALLSAVTSGGLSPLSYLGSTVDIDSATSVIQDGAAQWAYSVGDAKSVTLTVTDANGNVVHSETLSNVSGQQSYVLDFDDSSYDGAQLTLSIAATDANGESLDATIAARMTIDAIDSSSGTTLLEASGYQFDAGLVTRVSTKTEAASASDDQQAA